MKEIDLKQHRKAPNKDSTREETYRVHLMYKSWKDLSKLNPVMNKNDKYISQIGFIPEMQVSLTFKNPFCYN